MSPFSKYHHLALLLGTALLLLQTPLRADEVDRRKLFAKTVKGCCGVMTGGGPASGWVVDLDKRWVISCQHVVGNRDEIDVVFPHWKDGRLIQERKHYTDTAPRLKGKVISADAKRDLVIIQMETLPAGTTALPLAKESGQPGDNLHMIGNPAASGAMWNYAIGSLRAVYHKKFTYKDTEHEVDAMIGETQLPGNPGDSGAAVVNDQGEVVGVHSGGTPDKVQLMATYIDVAEVRAFLKQPLSVARAKSFKEWSDLGHQYYNLRDWDRAIHAYTEAIKLKSNDSESYRLRASAYIGKHLYDKAIEDCNEAIRINRGNANAYNERAVCYTFKQDYKVALEDYGEAIRLKPGDYIFLSGRAHVYNLVKEFDKAIEDADAAIKANPNDGYSFNERGLAYSWKKDYEKSLSDLNKAIKLDPNLTNAWYNRGVVKLLQKNYKAAIEDFNELIRLEPKHAQGHLERGKAYHWLTEYKKAIDDYTRTIAINPKSAHAYLYRSWCHRALGNEGDAATDHRRAEELDPVLARTKE
jgi:tetratricopeptide (TPR) repeat protein